MIGSMVQYSVWGNCCNSCDFCLRRDRTVHTKQQQIQNINNIIENIGYVDWKNKFNYGISLLGGELYFVTDKDVQKSFMGLIDVIINKIIKVSENPNCMYSSVTNGIYEPSFLFRVIDKIRDEVGINHVDLNFSYDLKYRFKTEENRKLVIENINKFHERYNYKTGVQMILTQYLINLVKEKKFDVNDFLKNTIPGNALSFLYPHPVHTGKKLDDFFFKRSDLLWFVKYLRDNNGEVYKNFLYSTRNSGTFKYTGFKYRDKNKINSDRIDQQPVLSDGKEKINPKCGHSVLYQCYSDCDKCMLCDLQFIDSDIRY